MTNSRPPVNSLRVTERYPDGLVLDYLTPYEDHPSPALVFGHAVEILNGVAWHWRDHKFDLYPVSSREPTFEDLRLWIEKGEQ